MTQKRSAIRARTRYERVDDFIEGYGRFFGRRSIFLRTRNDKEPGTVLRFEIQLADGRPIFRGEGVVVPPMEGDESEQGLRIRFSKLDRTSKDLLDEIRDSARSRAKARAASIAAPRAGEAPRSGSERAGGSGDDDEGGDHIVEEFEAAIDFLEPHDLDEQTGRRRAALLQAIARPHEPLDRPPSGAFSLSPADIDQIAGSLALDFDMMFETTDLASDDVLFDHDLGVEMSRELPRVLTGEYGTPSIFGEEGPEPDPELVEAVDSALDDVLGGFGGGFFAEPSGRVSSTRILVPEAVAEAASLYDRAEAAVETHEAPPPVIAPTATQQRALDLDDDEGEEVLDEDALFDDDDDEDVGDDGGDDEGIEELHPAHYPTETEQGGFPSVEPAPPAPTPVPAHDDEAAFHEAAFLAALADDDDDDDFEERSDDLAERSGDDDDTSEGDESELDEPAVDDEDDPFAAMLRGGDSAPYLSAADDDDDDLGLFGAEGDDLEEAEAFEEAEERPPHLDFAPDAAEGDDDFFVDHYEGPAPGPDDPTPVPFSARQMVFTGSHRGPDDDLDLAAYAAEAFEEHADDDVLAEEEAQEEPLHRAFDADEDDPALAAYEDDEDDLFAADTYEPHAPDLGPFDDDDDDASFDEAAGFDAEEAQAASAPIAAPGWSADFARAKTPSYAHEAVTRVAVGPGAPPDLDSPADTDSDLLPEPVPPSFDDDSDPYYDEDEDDSVVANELPAPAPASPRFPPSLRGGHQRSQQLVFNEQQTVPRRDYSEELAAISRAESSRAADEGPTIADLMRAASGDDEDLGARGPHAGGDDDLAVTFFLEEGTSVISPHEAAPAFAAPDDFQAAQLAALEADLEENPDEPAIVPTEAETGPAGPWNSRRDAAYDDLPPTDDEDDWLERVNRARDSLAGLHGGASYDPAIDDSLGDLALAAASNYDGGADDYDLGEGYGEETQGVYHHIADGEGVESGYRGFDQREVSEVLELGPDALIDNDELSLEEEFSLELVENGGLVGDDDLVLEDGPMAESHFSGMRDQGGQLTESDESESIASLLAEMMSDTPRSDSGRVELPLDLDDDDYSPPRR